MWYNDNIYERILKNVKNIYSHQENRSKGKNIQLIYSNIWLNLWVTNSQEDVSGDTYSKSHLLTSWISSGTVESINLKSKFRSGPACLPRMLVATPPASARARWFESSFRHSLRKLWCSLKPNKLMWISELLKSLCYPVWVIFFFLFKNFVKLWPIVILKHDSWNYG